VWGKTRNEAFTQIVRVRDLDEIPLVREGELYRLVSYQGSNLWST
jgi:hypothetical protein